MHTINKPAGNCQGFLWIGMIRTLANRRADMPDIQHWRKADINIHSNHFAGHQPTCLLRQFSAFFHSQQRSE